MISLLRVATTPLTLKSSSTPHKFSPCFSPSKRSASPVVLAGASHSRVADPPSDLVALRHLKGINQLATHVQQLHFLTRPLAGSDVDGDAANNWITNLGPPPNSTTDQSTRILNASTFPVHGPFDMLYCVQTGAFGSAWAAKDRSTGRVLCLKAFQSLTDPDVLRSVRIELKAFRRMVKSKRGERGRQFIMELNRSMQQGMDVFFAMELMSTDLGLYLYTEPERCRLHARRWMAQIALGIESLHEMGIIHRDIKTENILIDSRENIRIIDFGLVFLIPPNDPLSRGNDRAIQFLGTPPYMAAEVLRNKELPMDKRTPYSIEVDWWGLGCILFELESRDHEILFETEEDVHAYIAWTERQCQSEKIYPRFNGFDFLIEDLLEGLLDVQPSTRYSLNDLERHDYFLRVDGTSEFDNATDRGTNVTAQFDVESDMETVPLALQRPLRPELVPRSTSDHGPLLVVEAAKLETCSDWINVKWGGLVDG